MSIDFSAKEARKLINRHKELLRSLENINRKYETLRSGVNSSIEDMMVYATLKRVIVEECKNPSGCMPKEIQIENFIKKLYTYQRVQAAEEMIRTFCINNTVKIQQSMAALNPGLAGLSWIFGGRRAKEKAIQAYQELTTLLQGEYGQMIPQIVSEMEALPYISTSIAWEAYLKDPMSLLYTLKNINALVLREKKANPFQEELEQLRLLEKRIDQCQTTLDAEKEKIFVAAEKMKAHKALQILKNVPIEEINREKSGFRVKTLRDAGLSTMADIYTSTTHQLASLNGISDHAAVSMKRIAKEFLDDAQEDLKIKLSSDNRNLQSSELIKAIYEFRLKKAGRIELEKLVQCRSAVLTSAKETMEAVGSGIPWLFYSESQREKVRNAYEEMTSALDGEYAKDVARLTKMLVSKTAMVSAETAWTDFNQHSIEYITILEDIVPGVLGNDDSLYGLPEDLAREIQEEVFFPEGLLCSLRRYQEWGVKYILHQKKVLLGDEMGLGKTVQAIATMVSLRNIGATHFMVVCPASVITNWCREVVKHSRLRVTKIYGSDRMQALESWKKTGGVAVTTYETTEHIDDKIKNINILIVDEAHYIKNPEARRSQNVKHICEKAERLLFMTGTALENKVEEMVSLINILQPEVAESVQSMTFMPNAPQFRNKVAPVYYRRKRENVLTELPELTEIKEWCVLNSGEKEIYERNVLSKNFAASRRLSWNADDLTESCKASRLKELIEEARQEDRKVIVFSFFLDTISVVSEMLGARCYGPINGSVPLQRRQEIIDSFDKAPAGSVLLAQIQSGGTGLNIQSASVVIICEPQLKPSIENQAISRAYRMGQVRNVLVYRLLCEDTIDERIMDLLENKQKIFDAFADKSVAAEQSENLETEVDEKKFGQLIQEEIDRINGEKR